VKGNKASRRLDGPAFITDGILDLCLDSDQEVSKLTNSTKWPFHHKSPNFQQSKDNYHPRIRLPMNSSPAPPLNTVRRRLADANNRNQLERKYASSAKLRDVDVCESGSEKKSHQYGRLDDNSVEDNIDLDLRAMTTLKAARLLCNFEV
jgi:hypothetical protein